VGNISNLIWLALVGFSFIFHGVLLGIIVHELGHLFFGWCTGYKFLSFRVASFVWHKQDGRIKFARSKNAAVAGQCLMTPPEDINDFRFVWYNLGGGLFNFALAIIWLLAYIPSSAGFFSIFFILGFTFNLFFALANLLPIILTGIPVDGRNIYTALKSEDAKRGFHTMLYVNSEMAKGKRYSDFDPSLFSVEAGADTNNYFVAWLVMLDASRLQDLGEYEKSFLRYSSLNLNKLPGVYRNAIMLNQLYYHTIYRQDLVEAAAIFSDKKINTIVTQSKTVDYAWVIAAYEYFGLRNKQKALKTLARANKAAEVHPNRGERLVIKDELARVESLITASDMI